MQNNYFLNMENKLCPVEIQLISFSPMDKIIFMSICKFNFNIPLLPVNFHFSNFSFELFITSKTGTSHNQLKSLICGGFLIAVCLMILPFLGKLSINSVHIVDTCFFEVEGVVLLSSYIIMWLFIIISFQEYLLNEPFYPKNKIVFSLKNRLKIDNFFKKMCVVYGSEKIPNEVSI